MREYSLYIFDFDMTLYDSLRSVRLCYRKAFAAAGLPFDPKMTTVYIREALDQTFARFSDSANQWDLFKNAFILESEQLMGGYVRMYPETDAVIHTLKLRGKSLCIVSGKLEDRIRSILRRDGLETCFDHIIGFENMKEPKPSPYGIDWTLAQYNGRFSKSETCYVGDAQKDMLSAQAAGVDGIYIPRGNPDGAPCVQRISSLTELLDYRVQFAGTF
jgi:phosphoglycolate phosphatase